MICFLLYNWKILWYTKNNNIVSEEITLKRLLIVNACVRRETSRTNRLCRVWVEKLRQEEPYEVKEIILEEKNLHGLDTGSLGHRDRLIQEGHLEHEMFSFARDFRKADEIVIAAPYWDMSFPAALKCYLEAICVVGLTFRYREDGSPEGLCRAKRLTYITTAGGFIGQNDFGYTYVKALAGLFGIADIKQICAEGLDIVGNDVEAILHETEDKIRV